MKSSIECCSLPPWPVQSPAGGVALQLIDPLDDNARPGNWSAVGAFTGPRQPVAYTSSWRYLDSGAPGKLDRNHVR